MENYRIVRSELSSVLNSHITSCLVLCQVPVLHLAALLLSLVAALVLILWVKDRNRHYHLVRLGLLRKWAPFEYFRVHGKESLAVANAANKLTGLDRMIDGKELAGCVLQEQERGLLLSSVLAWHGRNAISRAQPSAAHPLVGLSVYGMWTGPATQRGQDPGSGGPLAVPKTSFRVPIYQRVALPMRVNGDSLSRGGLVTKALALAGSEGATRTVRSWLTMPLHVSRIQFTHDARSIALGDTTASEADEGAGLTLLDSLPALLDRAALPATQLMPSDAEVVEMATAPKLVEQLVSSLISEAKDSDRSRNGSSSSSSSGGASPGEPSAEVSALLREAASLAIPSGLAVQLSGVVAGTLAEYSSPDPPTQTPDQKSAAKPVVTARRRGCMRVGGAARFVSSRSDKNRGSAPPVSSSEAASHSGSEAEVSASLFSFQTCAVVTRSLSADPASGSLESATHSVDCALAERPSSAAVLRVFEVKPPRISKPRRACLTVAVTDMVRPCPVHIPGLLPPCHALSSHDCLRFFLVID